MGTLDLSKVDSLFLAKNRIEQGPSFYIVKRFFAWISSIHA